MTLDSSRATAAEAGGGPPQGLARLWAGWRTAYIARVSEDSSELKRDGDGRSLFERILDSGLPDDEAYVVHRGRLSAAVLNAYPYGSGHMLVLPVRAVADLVDLDTDETTDLWGTVTDAVTAARTAYNPDGVNVGLNLGAAAGAGVPDHLHVHVLPRWSADSNFMTSIAETRVLPEPLTDTYRKLRAPPGRRRAHIISVDRMAGDASDDDEDGVAATGRDDAGEVGDDEVTDALPDDLDVSGYVGPYLFPNNNRRRVPGYIYLGVAAGCIVAWFAGGNDHPWVNEGLLWAAVILVAAGGYCLVSGFDLDVDEQDALVAATRTVGFPVGHASAQMGWRGLRSRPTWRILCYSAENPPEQRGLVLVDGVDGEVIDFFVEENPEDWSDLDGALTGSGKPFQTGE